MRRVFTLSAAALLAVTIALISACSDGTYPPGAYYVPQGQPAPFTEPNRNRFPEAEPNPVRLAAEHPVSTFSIDVDTVSYAYARRRLNGGDLPEREAGACRGDDQLFLV